MLVTGPDSLPLNPKAAADTEGDETEDTCVAGTVPLALTVETLVLNPDAALDVDAVAVDTGTDCATVELPEIPFFEAATLTEPGAEERLKDGSVDNAFEAVDADVVETSFESDCTAEDVDGSDLTTFVVFKTGESNTADLVPAGLGFSLALNKIISNSRKHLQQLI